MIATMADGSKLTLPTLHFGVLGPPSSGKSRLLASMEKPLLVLALDPADKMQPYYDCGILDAEVRTGQFGQSIRIVKSATSGNAIIQIEGFYDVDDVPQAMSAFISRAEQLRAEVLAGRWKSIVIDSWTQLEYIARERRTTGAFAINSKHGAKVYGAAKDDLQQVFNKRFVHLPCHVGVALHIVDKFVEETGMHVRGIKAIGELKTELPGALGERYLAVNIDGTRRQLDTRNVPFNCCTLIDAPNPCANEFSALFSNWIKRETEKRAAKPAGEAAQPAAEAGKE